MPALVALTALAACSPSGETPDAITATDSALDPIPPPAQTTQAQASPLSPRSTPPGQRSAHTASRSGAAEQPSSPSARAEGMTTKRIRCAQGASSAIEEGSITGYDSVDYLLGV